MGPGRFSQDLQVILMQREVGDWVPQTYLSGVFVLESHRQCNRDQD